MDSAWKLTLLPAFAALPDITLIHPAAQGGDEPIATAVGHATVEPDWAVSYDGNLAGAADIDVEIYDGYIMLYGWAGVEGYNLKVAFDEEDNVVALNPIKKACSTTDARLFCGM